MKKLRPSRQKRQEKAFTIPKYFQKEFPHLSKFLKHKLIDQKMHTDKIE
jgi:hypothetical protein